MTSGPSPLINASTSFLLFLSTFLLLPPSALFRTVSFSVYLDQRLIFLWHAFFHRPISRKRFPWCLLVLTFGSVRTSTSWNSLFASVTRFRLKIIFDDSTYAARWKFSIVSEIYVLLPVCERYCAYTHSCIQKRGLTITLVKMDMNEPLEVKRFGP